MRLFENDFYTLSPKGVRVFTTPIIDVSAEQDRFRSCSQFAGESLLEEGLAEVSDVEKVFPVSGPNSINRSGNLYQFF